MADENSKTSVFLSYARADDDPDYDDPAKSFMRRLYDALTAAGFAVWWDRPSLPSRGLAFTAELEQAIINSDRFVLVVAPGAIASPYVQKEWELALSLCKPITPILRAGEYSLVPKTLGKFHAPDCRPTRTESAAFDEIISRLQDDAPLAKLFNVKTLPKGHVIRDIPFNLALQAILVDAINPTVISAPPHATAVYGVGGIGKSTFALALANNCDIRRKYPDGVIWIEIGQTPSIQTRLGDIGVALGDDRNAYVGQGTDEQSAAARLHMLLQAKRALIVLDDVWDHQVIKRFPVAGTPSRLLITTRNSKIAGLVEGAEIALTILTTEEGAELIAGRAGGDKTNPVYQQISAILGGHTLAIRLAADQLANGYADDPSDLLRLLTKRENLFAHLKVVEDDKDENLELSLSLSYIALPSDDLRRRFRALGVFPLEATFDRELLAAVWGDADPDDARQSLATLEGAGLLERAAESGRYTQHRLLRAYARALLESAGEMDGVFGWYADYVIKLSEKFDILSLKRWTELDVLIPHLHEIGDALADKWNQTRIPQEMLVRRVEAFSANTMIYLNHHPEVLLVNKEPKRLRWMLMGLDIWRLVGNREAEGGALNNIGSAYMRLGELRTALEYYKKALLLSQELNILEGEAALLNNIGMVWADLGDQHKAISYYESALLLRKASKDLEGEGAVLNNIGRAKALLGETRTALEYYEQALPLRKLSGDFVGEATTLSNMGLAWVALGVYEKALKYFDQALYLFRSIRGQRGEAAVLDNTGGVYHVLKQFQKALEYYKQALAISQTVFDISGEASILNNLGMTYNDLGEIWQALNCFEQALLLFRSLEDRASEATTLNNIGLAWDSLWNSERALKYYEQALVLSRMVHDRSLEATTLNNMAELFELSGELTKAIECAERSVTLFEEIEDPFFAEMQAVLARLERQRDGFEPPRSRQMTNMVQILTRIYAEQGVDVVRARLKPMNMSNDIREALITKLAETNSG